MPTITITIQLLLLLLLIAISIYYNNSVTIGAKAMGAQDREWGQGTLSFQCSYIITIIIIIIIIIIICYISVNISLDK
jgi:hypothetical protein